MKKGLTRRDLLKVSVGAVGGGIAATYGQAALHTQTPEATPTPVPTQAVETKSQAGLYAGAALEGKTGRLWGLEFDPHLETYRRLAILFQRKTGAALNVEPQPNHAFEFRLVAAQAAGTQPDLACIMGKHCVPLYMRGALLPLGYSLYKEMKIKPEEVFFEDAVLSYSWKDEIYGVPVEAGGLGNVVNVPVDDVRSLGLAHQYPPSDGRVWFQDYPEMFALARALQHEEHGEVVRWGLSSKGFDSSSYIGILRSLLAERGTDWWDLANAKFNVDTEEGVQAMKWFVEDPVKMGIEAEMEDWHYDAALAGKVALARGNGLPVVSGDSLGYNFEVSGVPMCVPGKPPLSCSEAGWGFVALKDGKNPDVALEFLKMMLTEEGQTGYAKAYGGIVGVAWKGLVGRFDHWANPDPNNKGVRFAKVYQQKLQPLARYYGTELGYYDKVDLIFSDTCSLVRQQKMTAQEGCQVAQQRLEAQYKRWQEDMLGRL